MLYLEFLDGQGLGNQLWNYVTLRSLSNKLGYEFEIINPNKFKGKSFLQISYSTNKVRKKKFSGSHNLKIFREKLFYDKSLKTFVSDFDKEILQIKQNTLLKGLFQSEKYLFNNDINQYIKLKNPDRYKSNCKDHKCILNIRGGEYKRFKELILPKSYWLHAMKNMKNTHKNMKFYIVTDDYDYAKNLLPELKILKGNMSDDFTQLFNSEYLIVSNSSFAYFPITMGEKPKKIIAPSKWSRFGNIHQRWISPANYYENWFYQNEKGKIISNENIEKVINNTRHFYSKYNVLTTEESITEKSLLSFLPNNFKKLIKKVLSKIFPLYIG